MMIQSDTKTLVKILIAAAWLDGKIQPEERTYLRRLAQEQGLEKDRDIYPWLYELRSVSSDECYEWIEQYLGPRPTPEACQNLIEAVSGLIYSDGKVANEEACLLMRLQKIEIDCGSTGCTTNVLSIVRGLYQRWVAIVDNSYS